MRLFPLLVLIVCANNSIAKVSSENLDLSSLNDVHLIKRQSRLITLGFSNVFWDHISDSNDSINAVSNQCSYHLNKILRSMQTGQLWAFKMLSASGSRPNNFLDGTYATFGSYDSCLSITEPNDSDVEPKVRGQYCLTSLEPDFSPYLSDEQRIMHSIIPHHFDSVHNLTIKVGLCVPSTCSAADIELIMTKALDNYSWNFLNVHQCDVETTFLDRLKSAKTGQKIFFSILIILISLIAWGSLIDIQSRSSETQSYSAKTFLFWIQQFSAIKSIRSLLRKPDRSPRVLILDQLRVASLIIVLIIHSLLWFTMIGASFLIEDVNRGLDLLRKPDTQPWVNDWVTEGLMLIGGSSAAVNLLYKMKPETPLTAYVYNIFRRAAILAPVMLITCAIEIVLPLFGSGPFYNSIAQYRSDICVKNFIYNILHIQNQCGPLEICSPHTWSFAVEWQLFIVMCVAVYIYKRNDNLGLSFNIFMIIFGLYRVSRIFYTHNLAPHFLMVPFNSQQFAERMWVYYIAFESHIWSYFWALLLIVLLAGNYEAKIEKYRPQLYKIVISLTVLQLYSSIPWNVLSMKIEPLTTAIYVIISKMITGLFFMILLLPFGKQIRNFLATAKPLNMHTRTENNNISETSCNGHESHEKQISCDDETSKDASQFWTQVLESKPYFETSKLLHSFEITFRLLKSSYFIHAAVDSWYFISFRTTIPFKLSSFIVHSSVLLTLAIFGGILFYILIIGPVERINYIISKKSQTSKIHSS